MHRSRRVTRLVLAVVLGLALGLPAGAGPASVPPAAASHLVNPASVTVVGSLQNELGCGGDWDPACAATHLDYSASHDVWTKAFSVPAGNWEYKAALNDSWTNNYGANGLHDGPNIGLNLASPTTVKFYYDNQSHWITDSVTSRIVTAPGSYQSEVGCAGDWQPECLATWLQDVDGDGTYSWSSDSIPIGSYDVKAAINEGWAENYGEGGAPNGSNIPFSVGQAGSTVAFSFVSATNTLSVTVTPPSGSGSAGHDNDVWWSDLGHDSRDPLYRSPGGAVTAGTPVTLRLRAASGDLTQARVRVWNDRSDSQSLISMTRAADDGTHEWWQATLPASSVPTIFWYRFIAIDGSATAYYEDDAARTGGWGETFGSSPDQSWQLTVYDPGFSTPDWVKNAVIYQIFPDRFRNGDATNDPAAGEFFYGETPTVYRSHGSDWHTPICDPRDAGGTCPNVYSQNFYGGDLAGIVDKLDYLDDLGITAIYLNPIFESPSNHKYDTTDFSSIDPSFGDQALFQTLASAADARGMRLILDGVFNHTSSDSLYFDRYGRHATDGACESAASPYRDWYHFTPVAAGLGECVGDDGTPLASTYESWFGYDSLPKLNSANSEVRDFFYAGTVNPIGPYWLSWADGWRLDVGGDVDPGLTNNPGNDYWEGFRAAARAANPDAYIVGEEWGMATAWTLGAEWDATMNYQLSSALLSFYRDELFVDNDHNTGSSAGTLAPLTPSQLAERLLNLQERYPPEAFYALMNLLGSHDTNRPMFMLDHNADLTDRSIYENPAYDWSDALGRLKGVALLQATLPGAPTIYYGDEVGLVAPPTHDGATWQDDPYNRIPYPWLDESGTPFYAHLQAGGAGHTDLLPYYTLLLGTRNDHPALRTGSLDILHADDASDTFAYGRKLADHSDAALVLVNRSASAQLVELDLAGYLPVGAQFSDVLAAGASHTVDASGGLSVNLPAGGSALLVLSAPMAAAPAAVTDLAVTGERSTEIDLDWSAAAGATSYDVYRSSVSGGGYGLVANTASTGFTDTGLPTATTHHYVVVSRDDASLLASGQSNEVVGTTGHDLGDGGSSWFNLQWPPSMTHTLSTTDRTDSAVAQIWVSGATEAAGQAPGMRAQLGFGPDGSQPDSAWSWSEMSFNVQVGNNDEYIGDMLPTTTGEFDYAVRWSGDGGSTWYLADLNGPQRDGTLDNPGALTVNAGSDTNAPTAPVLSVDGVTASSVSLSWTASTDDVGVAGYEVFRDGVEIAELGAATTSFVDESVTTGQTYAYVVRAFDTSFNRSPDSNEQQATAENRMVQVTFRVGVPAFTPADAIVYVTGSISELGPFNPSAYPMTLVSGVWERTFSLADGTSFEWKYTRGSWETVEQWDSISGLANRGPITVDYGDDGTMLIDNTATDWGSGADSGKAVRQWRDPLVASHSPADGATDVAVETTVVVGWSKPMSSATDFTVTGPDGPVAGAFALSNGDQTLTFTPDAPLAHETEYDLVISGETSAGGDAQQVPVSFGFTTAAAPPVVLESVVVTPADAELRNGRKLQLTATAHYSDGSSVDVTDQATWVTSNRRAVSVSQSGLAHARRYGAAVISATYEDVTGQTAVTVPHPRR